MIDFTRSTIILLVICISRKGLIIGVGRQVRLLTVSKWRRTRVFTVNL